MLKILRNKAGYGLIEVIIIGYIAGIHGLVET